MHDVVRRYINDNAKPLSVSSIKKIIFKHAHEHNREESPDNYDSKIMSPNFNLTNITS